MFTQVMHSCPSCGSRLSGRSDKKFCNDQCRSDYNNRSSMLRLGLVKRINMILRRNRKILQQRMGKPPVIIPKDELQVNGFDFRFYTHCQNTGSGQSIYFCYDMGYITRGNTLELIKEDVQ